MSRYRVIRSNMIVTKPSGECSPMEILLYYDTKVDTFGILLTGSGTLKGYAVDVLQRELKRARDQGEPLETLPKIEVEPDEP